MKVSAEKADNQKMILTIEVPAEELTKAMTTACKQLSNRVNIPGFRKGHVPEQILIRNIGERAVLDEAFDIIAQKSFDEALIEQKIEPVDRPQIEVVTLEKGKDVVFKATLTPKPEVTLGEYKGLKIDLEVKDVTDEQVDEQIENIRKHHAKMVDAPEGSAVEKDNFVTLDFLGKVDDKPFQGGEAKDYPLQVGSGHFIEGFEDQLIGMKVGEEKDVKVKFPEEYHEKSLAGKDAIFHCKINSIKVQQLPELDDAFAAKATSYKTVNEMKKGLRENLAKSAQMQAETDRRNKALDTICASAKVDIPEVMIENRINGMINELAASLESNGMSMDQYLQYSKKSIDELRKAYREEAAKTVKIDLVLEAVAKAEDLRVENKEIDAEVAMMAMRYGSTPKEIAKVIKKNGYFTHLLATVGRKKAAQFIMDNLQK